MSVKTISLSFLEEDDMENIKLYHGDCLEVMKDIPDKSVDMILCDLPYNLIASKWVVSFPFD